MTSLNKAVDAAVRALDTLLALVILSMVALACVNAGLRYLWGETLIWADETLIFAMIGVTFLGAIGVAHRRRHLRMGLVAQAAPAWAAKILTGLELATTAGVCLFVANYSLETVLKLIQRGTLSNMAEVPLWALHAMVLAGLALTALVSLLQLAGLLLGHAPRGAAEDRS